MNRPWQVVPLDLSERVVTDAILTLQRVGYAAEAEILGVEALPPMLDTAETLMASGEQYHGVWWEGALAGVMSLEEQEASVELCRLAVAPRAFRQGIGRALVHRAVDLAAGRNMTVCTGKDNGPALALYRSEGFVEKEVFWVPEGFQMVCLVRQSPQ